LAGQTPLQGVSVLGLETPGAGGGTVVGICGVTIVTVWGSLTSPGGATHVVAVEQPVTAVVLPDKASTPPPPPHAPTPVSGLAKVPLTPVPGAVFTFPLEPRLPS